MSVLKRQREMRKAEKAARKRDLREERSQSQPPGGQVATQEDLAGYGFDAEEEDEKKENS